MCQTRRCSCQAGLRLGLGTALQPAPGAGVKPRGAPVSLPPSPQAARGPRPRGVGASRLPAPAAPSSPAPGADLHGRALPRAPPGAGAAAKEASGAARPPHAGSGRGGAGRGRAGHLCVWSARRAGGPAGGAGPAPAPRASGGRASSVRPSAADSPYASGSCSRSLWASPRRAALSPGLQLCLRGSQPADAPSLPEAARPAPRCAGSRAPVAPSAADAVQGCAEPGRAPAPGCARGVGPGAGAAAGGC